MACRVLKFGGTSVANIERLQHVAGIIQRDLQQGHKVVVVVSAMAGITNQLVGYAQAFDNGGIISCERDVVYSAGEQVSAGLLALTLQHNGINARSFLAWQLPIRTDDAYTHATIKQIDIENIENTLKEGIVPVIAGYQGVCDHNRLTTLGRGGSDTTAVAIAVALKAKDCLIYTDVNGVYSADPRLIPDAKLQQTISYAEMFEMASSGARVLHARAVELAMKHKVDVRILSSFNTQNPPNKASTQLIEGAKAMDNFSISGVVHTEQDVKISLSNLPDNPGVVAKIFEILSKNRIDIDMFTQNFNLRGCVDMLFTCHENDLEQVKKILEEAKQDIGFSEIIIEKDIAKLSIIGNGLKSNLEVSAGIFKTLGDLGINIKTIFVGDLRISVLISTKRCKEALQALHKKFEFNIHEEGVAA